MTAYVLELGVKSGEGEFVQWDSDGFYAGYEPNGGPMIVTKIAYAFRFATMEHAQRIPGGDERIKQRHRIVQVPGEPNV